MKTIREKIENFAPSYPASIAVVLAKGKEKINAMPAAWHMPVSFKPPLYAVSISPKRYTHKIITEVRNFSLNFLTFASIEIIHKLGHTSGAEFDKLEYFDIKTEKSLKISSPIISLAFAAYECTLFDFKTYGDHTIFIGEIVAVHTEDENFTTDGIIHLDRIQPALYLGNYYYATTDRKNIRSTKDIVIG